MFQCSPWKCVSFDFDVALWTFRCLGHYDFMPQWNQPKQMCVCFFFWGGVGGGGEGGLVFQRYRFLELLFFNLWGHLGKMFAAEVVFHWKRVHITIFSLSKFAYQSPISLISNDKKKYCVIGQYFDLVCLMHLMIIIILLHLKIQLSWRNVL